MITALFDAMGSEAFSRFMESAIATASADVSSSPGANGLFAASQRDRVRGVDWVRLGQLLRHELGWDDYPVGPPTHVR
jgi:hypothetical protein